MKVLFIYLINSKIKVIVAFFYLNSLLFFNSVLLDFISHASADWIDQILYLNLLEAYAKYSLVFPIKINSAFSVSVANAGRKAKSGRRVRIGSNLLDWKKFAVKIYNPILNIAQRNVMLDENKGKSGIYLLENTKNGKKYVGQSIDLGNRRQGRLIRYFTPSYLHRKGASLILKALIKYKPENFIVAILEYCPVNQLDTREQHWLDSLKPEYNILKFARSSRGYKHTQISLNSMRGRRPHFIPSASHRAAIGLAASKLNRVYDQQFKDNISKRVGFLVYVYDITGGLITTFDSVIKLKKAYNIKLHHKTLYKHIAAGTLFNGHRFSLTPLNLESFNSLAPALKLNNPNKGRHINCINTLNTDLSKICDSLLSAAKHIKEVDGKSDRETIRKYIDSGKLYKNKWLISECS